MTKLWQNFFKIRFIKRLSPGKRGRRVPKLLTICNRKGLYKLNRRPFGLKVAPSLFTQIMDAMLAGLEFIVDDIQIKSENNDQHKGRKLTSMVSNSSRRNVNF